MSGWWAVSYVVLWVLVLVLSALVVGLARQVGTLHLRLGPRGALEIDDEGPPLGEAPEPFETRTDDGRSVVVGGPGEPQFLLFTSPGCPVCREVVPSLAVVAQAGGMTALEVSDGDRPPARSVDEVVSVAAPDVATAYRVPGTPYAVVLDAAGIVRAKGTVNNLEQMEGLVDTARRRLELSARETGH